MAKDKETIVDHAWRHHYFNVGKPVDLSRAAWRQVGERWDGYYFHVDDLGLVHLFLNRYALGKGFVLDENFKPTVREVTLDEMLHQLTALTMSAYVFDGGEHYKGFQPNPVDNSDIEDVSTCLEARIHFPGGLTFRSHGTSIDPARESGSQDRTLRWFFETWCLDAEENLPIYLIKNPEHFKERPELIKPEFVKLERPASIRRG